METTFGRTVETKRINKSNYNNNRSNCSLANLSLLNQDTDRLNQFLNEILLEKNKAKNNENTRRFYKTNTINSIHTNTNHKISNTSISDKNSMNQFDSQLERINNELARAQFMTQINCNLKKANSGYLSDSDCYSTKLPSRLRIKNNINESHFETNSNRVKAFNMQNSCINMSTSKTNANDYLLNDLGLKLSINNPHHSSLLKHHKIEKTLKQNKNDFYYNLIKTNQFKNLKKTNDLIGNRSFRVIENTNSNWAPSKMNHSQLLSPAVRSRLINHRCSNETLSINEKPRLHRETNIDFDSSESPNSYLDSRSYLTWKNFNYTPALAAKHRNNFEKKINLDEEINQLKQKFRNQYVCEDFLYKNSDVNNDNMIKIEPCEYKNASYSFSSPSTPLLHSYTLPKHSRFTDSREKSIQMNNDSTTNRLNQPIRLDLSRTDLSEKSKFEVVPLENALLNMNEILKNLTLNSNKRNNEFESLKSSFKTEDFLTDEKLKDISPPLSTSTSISLSPPPPSYNLQNTNKVLSMSPSSSLSSSSYANSCKSSTESTTSANLCENSKSDGSKMSDRSLSIMIENSNRTTFSESDFSNNKFAIVMPEEMDEDKKPCASTSEKTEHISFGKKLKRFLSINTGSFKRNTENDRFFSLKKKLFQN